MEDESIHNNPQDLVKYIFDRLEAQVTNINRNMNLFMVALPRKLGPFVDDGGSNSKIILDGKLGDWEDLSKESRKEPKKEQSSLSVVNPSQSIFMIYKWKAHSPTTSSTWIPK